MLASPKVTPIAWVKWIRIPFDFNMPHDRYTACANEFVCLGRLLFLVFDNSRKPPGFGPFRQILFIEPPGALVPVPPSHPPPQIHADTIVYIVECLTGYNGKRSINPIFS